MTLMELSGLTGDHHPMAILGRSVLGTSALVLSGVTVWFGLIKLVSEDDPGNWFSLILHDFLSTAMINRIVGMIWSKAHEDGFAAAVIDCTGHGVPGGIMTMAAVASLNRVVSDIGVQAPTVSCKK